MAKWRSTYRSNGNYYIYEAGKIEPIMKILGTDNHEKLRVIQILLEAVNNYNPNVKNKIGDTG